jgi:hypothetical protein
MRPSLLEAAGARPANVRGAKVAPASTVLVVFRKSRRSIFVPLVKDLSKQCADKIVGRILTG